MDLDHERRLSDVENRSKANQHRLDKVEKRQDELGDLVTSVRILAEREESVENDVKEIKQDVKKLTDKPAERWNSLVDKIVLAVATGIIGFILAKIGF